MKKGLVSVLLAVAFLAVSGCSHDVIFVDDGPDMDSFTPSQNITVYD